MTDKLFFIREVPEYLLMKYSCGRTRRAVTYWTTKGYLVRGHYVRLRTERTRDNQVYTRQAWVDKFIEKVSRR